LNSTTIAWSTFRSISSIDHLHHPPLFFLWLAVAMRLHGMPCVMPPWAYRARLVIHHWWWSDHHLRTTMFRLSIIEPWRLHLEQYTLKVIDLYLRTNINFLIVFFILMPPPNSLEISSSRAFESWTNTINSDPICCDEIDILWYQLLRA